MDVDAVGSAAAPQAQAEQPSKAPPPPGGAAGDAEWWLSDGEEPDSDGGAEAAGPAGDGDELYGEELDDKDDAWATKQRQGRESDAILSCPCCLETLCLDCQKHARYQSQFRAMFVRNCRVNRTERLRAKPAGGAGGAAGRGAAAAGGAAAQAPGQQLPRGADADELFFSVHCGTCDTQVGVFDDEEVYHFFNVVATTA